jgi:acyl dehydratase
MRMAELHKPDTRVNVGTYTFTDEKIIRFARSFDPQPFHVDAEAAKGYVFGGLCASGWHTAGAWMQTFLGYWQRESERLTREGQEPPKLGPSPGFTSLKWQRPVFAGETVTYYVTLTGSRALASRPGLILNTTLVEAENQDQVPVLRFDGSVLEYE